MGKMKAALRTHVSLSDRLPMLASQDRGAPDPEVPGPRGGLPSGGPTCQRLPPPAAPAGAEQVTGGPALDARLGSSRLSGVLAAGRPASPRAQRTPVSHPRTGARGAPSDPCPASPSPRAKSGPQGDHRQEPPPGPRFLLKTKASGTSRRAPPAPAGLATPGRGPSSRGPGRLRASRRAQRALSRATRTRAPSGTESGRATPHCEEQPPPHLDPGCTPIPDLGATHLPRPVSGSPGEAGGHPGRLARPGPRSYRAASGRAGGCSGARLLRSRRARARSRGRARARGCGRSGRPRSGPGAAGGRAGGSGRSGLGLRCAPLRRRRK